MVITRIINAGKFTKHTASETHSIPFLSDRALELDGCEFGPRTLGPYLGVKKTVKALYFSMETGNCHFIQGGTLLVINGVIAPVSRVITPVTTL